jgi:hypothetical protein
MKAVLVRPMAVAKRTRCCSTPPKRISKKYVKQAVDHAKNLCLNFEDTIECRHAWEIAEELLHAYYDQESAIKHRRRHDTDEMCKEDPGSCREYDV